MNSCTVIMYHYVRDLSRSRYPEIKGLDLKLFNEQIERLSRQFTFITMEDILACVEEDVAIPANSAYLTFDDGYIDHYTNVFPVLKRKNIQGAFYIPTQIIRDKKVLDVNKIHFVLACVKDKSKIISDIFEELNKYRQTESILSNEEYYSQLAKPNRFDTADVIFIKRILQHVLPDMIKNEILDVLFNKYVTSDEAAFSQELYVSEEQIKLMHESGMHIGGHGANHLWFNKIDSKSKEYEIKESISFLNQMTNNSPIKSISYPFGAYDEETVQLATKYGFRAGFTTKVSKAEINKEKRMILSRFDTNDFKE